MRPRPVELMLDKGELILARKAKTVEQIVSEAL
jgi:hypothetical protein